MSSTQKTSISSSSSTPDSTVEPSSPDQETSNPSQTDSSDGNEDLSPPNEPEQTDQDQAEEGDPANREAARYRVRLREAEAERDRVAAQLESVATHVVNGEAARYGVNAEGLRAAGHDLGAFFNDEGTFDAEAVRQAAEDTAGRFGIKRPGAAGYVPGSGTGGEKQQTHGWETVLKRK